MLNHLKAFCRKLKQTAQSLICTSKQKLEALESRLGNVNLEPTAEEWAEMCEPDRRAYIQIWGVPDCAKQPFDIEHYERWQKETLAAFKESLSKPLERSFDNALESTISFGVPAEFEEITWQIILEGKETLKANGCPGPYEFQYTPKQLQSLLRDPHYGPYLKFSEHCTNGEFNCMGIRFKPV